jgi:hypothetical protein
MAQIGVIVGLEHTSPRRETRLPDVEAYVAQLR